MKFTIEIKRSAAKVLAKLDRAAQRRIEAALALLAETPRPPGAKMLVGADGLYRVRTGDYRIIYQIRDDRLVVLVVKIGHRSDIYK